MVAISKQSQGGGTFLCQKDFCAISFLFSHVGVYYFAKNVKKNNVKKKSFTIRKGLEIPAIAERHRTGVE